MKTCPIYTADDISQAKHAWRGRAGVPRGASDRPQGAHPRLRGQAHCSAAGSGARRGAPARAAPRCEAICPLSCAAWAPLRRSGALPGGGSGTCGGERARRLGRPGLLAEHGRDAGRHRASRISSAKADACCTTGCPIGHTPTGNAGLAQGGGRDCSHWLGAGSVNGWEHGCWHFLQPSPRATRTGTVRGVSCDRACRPAAVLGHKGTMFDVRSGIQSGPANLQRAAFARGGRAAAFAFLRRPCLRMCDAQMIEAQEAVASRSPRCVHALIPSGSAGSAGAGGCSVWVIWLGFGLRVGDGSGKMDRSTCAVVVASLCVKWRVCMNRVRE